MKLNVFYLVKQQNDDGGWTTEESMSGEYDVDVFVPPTWSTFFFCESFESENVREAFDKEDGDCDYYKYIAVITDEKDRLLFSDRWSLQNQKLAKQRLLLEANEDEEQ